MDLCEAFDTLNHDLLIAKLNAYIFQHNILEPIYSYLTKNGIRQILIQHLVHGKG